MSEILKSPASENDLVAVSFESLVIYRDPETKGHWMPREALKRLAERQLEHELPTLLEIDADTMHHSGRFCPEDDIELVEYEFAESGIKMEQCLSCKGVWLDAGELKKLMEYVYDNPELGNEAEEDEHIGFTTRLLLFLYQLTEHPPMI